MDSRGTCWPRPPRLLLLGAANLYYYNLAPSPFDLRVMGQADLRGRGRGLAPRAGAGPATRAARGPDVPVEIDLVRPEPRP